MNHCSKRHVSPTWWYNTGMSQPDLNLLVTLDVLLQEGSVVGAAQRLELSASAMSRALARLREATGDPLLVRAGRGLVATPRAILLRDQVRLAVAHAEQVLRPALMLDLKRLDRQFTIRSSEGFVETHGPALIARTRSEAPRVRLWFQTKPDKGSAPLRDGSVDLETGVVSQDMGPELKTLGLFQDRFVGVVRAGHPLLRHKITAKRFAAAEHVAIIRQGLAAGPIDEALEIVGLKRNIAATVTGFSSAIALARASDLVATVPEHHSSALLMRMATFALPVPTPGFTVSMIWHPRMDGDAAHRWLRTLVHESVCAGAASRRK